MRNPRVYGEYDSSPAVVDLLLAKVAQHSEKSAQLLTSPTAKFFDPGCGSGVIINSVFSVRLAQLAAAIPKKNHKKSSAKSSATSKKIPEKSSTKSFASSPEFFLAQSSADSPESSSGSSLADFHAQIPVHALVILSNLYAADIVFQKVLQTRRRLRRTLRDFLSAQQISAQNLDYRFWPLVELLLERNIIHANLLSPPAEIFFTDWQHRGNYNFSPRRFSLAELFAKAQSSEELHA